MPRAESGPSSFPNVPNGRPWHVSKGYRTIRWRWCQNGALGSAVRSMRMYSLNKGSRRALAIASLLLVPCGCGASAQREAQATKGGIPLRPEDARVDVAYYRSRAAALATEAP